MGNIFETEFEKKSEFAEIVLKDLTEINKNKSGTEVELLYTKYGFMENNNIVIQKEIADRVINQNEPLTFNISNLKLGMKIEDIDASISSANIKTKIINPLNLDVDYMYVELWNSEDKNANVNWNEAVTIQVAISDFDDFTLNNLLGANYYFFRVYYYLDSTKLYTYDVDSSILGCVYKFETLTTIGIENLTVGYNARNYREKTLDISYNLMKNRSNMFQKIKYSFYEENSHDKIELTNENIVLSNINNNYEILEGSLIVTNGSYPDGTLYDSVLEMINITPENNVFDFNKSYIIEIEPFVHFDNDYDYVIEKVTQKFKLDALKNPSIGLKLIRKEIEDLPYLRLSISISDKDKIIYGETIGEYKIKVYKYKENISEAVQVNLYDKVFGGNNCTNQTFNIIEHAGNYSLYVQPADADFSYNYYAEIVLNYDKKNKGEEYLEIHKEKYTLKSITNEFDISVGSPLVLKTEDGIEVRFYDSDHNMQKIDKIDYSVFNISNNFNQSGSIVPDWTSVNDDKDGVTYTRIYLPIVIGDEGVYTIKMNLYSNDVLISQTDSAFMNEK